MNNNYKIVVSVINVILGLHLFHTLYNIFESKKTTKTPLNKTNVSASNLNKVKKNTAWS